MSEQNPNIPTPEEAQDLAQAAVQFGITTDTVVHNDDYRRNPNGVVRKANVEAGQGIFNRAVKIGYTDFALTDDATRPSGQRHTDASVRINTATPEQVYKAHVRTGSTGALNRLLDLDTSDSHASVERSGYGTHVFSDANKMKAGALITSLAAKRMAIEASEIADSRVAAITAAKEVYARRVAVTDETPDAEPIKVVSRTKFTN